MSTPERDHEALRPIARDAATRLDDALARARPLPDFSAMLARARELDPDAVSERDLARAGAFTPALPHGERDDADALAPFTHALRAELDARLDERRMASIPPPPLPRRRRAAALAGLALAAAALALFALVRPDLLVRRNDADGVAAAAAGNLAGRADAVAPPPVEHVSEDRPEDPAPADSDPAPAPAPESVPSDMPQKTVDKAARPARRSHAARPGERPPAPAGPSLEDEAQALWNRGELAAAERKYREIVAIAGASARAELAYGDLFALARQLRGADGQAAVWRDYLARFPAGRFADDARAGLCRRAPTSARAACWRDYLEHHPAGAHVKQAEGALAAAAPAPGDRP